MNVERGKKGFQSRPVPERFWAKVQKSDGCWNWIGATDGRYGQFFLTGELVRAHRFAYEQAYGVIPAGLWVLHKCDNPRCIRPDHLSIGIQQRPSGIARIDRCIGLDQIFYQSSGFRAYAAPQ